MKLAFIKKRSILFIFLTPSNVLLPILFTVIILTMIIPEVAQSKRFTSDIPIEKQLALLKLENQIGFDVETGIFIKPYSQSSLEPVFGELQSDNIQVRFWAIDLLTKVIKQLNVPKAYLRNSLRPMVDKLRESNMGRYGEAGTIFLGRTKRALWHMEYKLLANREDQQKFLEANLLDSTDPDYYYSFESMEYLVELGGEDSKRVLQKTIQTSGEKLPKIVSDGLNISVDKIDIKLKIIQLDGLHAAGLLNELITKRKNDVDYKNIQFSMWLIRQLESIPGPEGIESLRAIWTDTSYNLNSRYQAQEALYRLGAIKDSDRTIVYLP